MAKDKTSTENDTASDVAKSLLAELKRIDRPGAFCSTGGGPGVLPGLEVKGLGAIGLPLSAKQAKDLKAACEQAPYGKGEKTLVDTKVRRVWRLSPDRFKLGNPGWKEFLDGAVAKVIEEFGLGSQKLEAHLYDLLVYEKGSFFLPHRDSEKLDRMVATLIIMLPSVYEGGELIVRHEGQEQVVDFSGPGSQFNVHFAAFYADCEHEVKPLRSGHRLCLVYNLTLAKSKSKTVIAAPRPLERVSQVAKVLSDWSKDVDGPRKLVIPMEYVYTQEGLAWDALKGVDRTRARLLSEAARQADCDVHLALVTLFESGLAEDEYRSSSQRYVGRGWEPSYGGDGDKGKYKMEEVYDTSFTVEHWRGLAGERPQFGAVSVRENEVVPPGELRK